MQNGRSRGARRRRATIAARRRNSQGDAASSANTRSAEDRLASPRAASTSATSALSDIRRAAASASSRRQKAASSDRLVRLPATVSERLTKAVASRLMGYRKPMAVKGAPVARAPLGFRRALRLGATELRAPLGGEALALGARLALAGETQVDDLAHGSGAYFLRNASIDTTFAGS